MVNYKKLVSKAVVIFWSTRFAQAERQSSGSGPRDAGNRSSVTGGKQMAGFEAIIEALLVKAGVPRDSIYCRNGKRELPGYFRPEKNWDFVVVHNGALIACIEFKSQVGSFGNNFNKRAEQALGNATDLWTAYREGAFAPSPRPWLGYLMLLEDAPGSTRPMGKFCEPHFKVFDDFRGASYARRYELFVLRMLRERLYDGACLIMSASDTGLKGRFREPNEEVTFERFASSLVAHATAQIQILDGKNHG